MCVCVCSVVRKAAPRHSCRIARSNTVSALNVRTHELQIGTLCRTITRIVCVCVCVCVCMCVCACSSIYGLCYLQQIQNVVTSRGYQPSKSLAATCPSSNSARSGHDSFIISTIQGILVLAKILHRHPCKGNNREYNNIIIAINPKVYEENSKHI